MSQKVHPKAFRIRRVEDWETRGFYKNHAESLEEDFKIRQFLEKKLKSIGIERVEIERFPTKTNLIISSARPGLIIGRGGEGVENLKKEIENKIIKAPKNQKKTLRIEIREIKDPWLSATLSGQQIAQQIEKRMAYRRVLKQSLGKIVMHKEVKGARIQVAGRLNGVEIARREWVGEGQLPRQTIRADIDYAQVEAHCTYGVIGIKVWIYKGDKFDR